MHAENIINTIAKLMKYCCQFYGIGKLVNNNNSNDNASPKKFSQFMTVINRCKSKRNKED